MSRGPILASLALSLAAAPPATAQADPPHPLSSIGDSRAPSDEGARIAPLPRQAPEVEPDRPAFAGESASGDVHLLADWVAASGDSHGLPFLIVDKVNARVFVFDGRSRIRGSAPALLGLGRGDDSVPGIGQRRLATMGPGERTTPAGRFEAALGHDLDQDVLWVDYGAALSLHRVIVGNPSDHRHQRLASATPLDNRISYGCINVPAAFYDKIVVPAFTGTVGIVYILPETRPAADVFGSPSAAAEGGSRHRPQAEGLARGGDR
jgi:hypothetical protein